MALENDASCVEALYNLGLCNKKLGLYEEALEGFFKLQSIVRNHSEVVYHIANIFELMGDFDQVLMSVYSFEELFIYWTFHSIPYRFFI